MKEFYFERLEVWQQSRVLAKEIYTISVSFPSEEKFGLISQIRRATLSISANIAEGMARITEKDKARFINQAFSSAIEVVNFLILANDLNLLTKEDYMNLRDRIEKITNQLNSLYKKFEK
ncbi:four helix bundle protein [Myroides sp. JBRI-B21084]|uniref:four helix bundle protein n=1 Tax=Myroides sp. JBRI-B21084 TaxID=3119977 RepID=UPI0026E3D68B|nr:four helix bundle protein [Paenimyroides cloacae]WKW45551.1 four helix bundle protein [Paenimyroides cloacae]